MSDRRGGWGRAAAWLVAAGCAVALIAPIGRANAARPDPAVMYVRVTGSEVGRTMPPGFVGLSVEYPALSAYLGNNPSAPNPMFLGLVRALSPGQSPILRIGGKSTDATWWPTPGVPAPAGISYTLTPEWLAATHALAARLRARLILGINLAEGSARLAANEAQALVSGIGSRYVDALEIGNEADVYTAFPWYRSAQGRSVYARTPDYDVNDYIAQFSAWRAALPALPLAGPAFAENFWMPALGPLLTAEPQLAIVTYHRYPLRACEPDPTQPDYATIPNLMSDNAAAGLAHAVASYAAVSHRHGRPFRLDELNSASCEGRAGVSNTFASALWALDTLFNLAAVGVDGVNFHTLPGAAYAPFTFTHTSAGWRADVEPIYYGLLMFIRAFPTGARLLAVRAPAGPLKIWATHAPDGRTRVVLINKSGLTAARVAVQIPAVSGAMTVERLSAPDLTATGDVTLGGRSFPANSASATLPLPAGPASLHSGPDGYEVSLPAGSAVMLTSAAPKR